MPKLLSRSKHEEFESNSALQIRAIRKEEQKTEEKGPQQKFCRVANFGTVSKLPLSALFIMQPLFIHPALLTSCIVYLFDSFLSLFCFLPNLSLVIAFDFGFCCNFAWPEQYICSYTVIKENFFFINKIGEKFSVLPLFSIFSHFLPFFFII